MKYLQQYCTTDTDSSVNFVFDSIFVFVIVQLTTQYFRFRLFLVFESIFVLIFVSFLYYRFSISFLPLLAVRNSAHAIPLPHTRQTPAISRYSMQSPVNPHHNVTFNHLMCATVQDKIRNIVYNIAITGRPKLVNSIS